MTTEQTDVANTSDTTLQTIYVNMSFDKIAEDVNGTNTQLVPTFNGEGRNLVKLLPSQEPTFLFYSEDQAGQTKIKPPFDFANNSQVKFILQAAPTDSNIATSKWVDINQSYYDLKLVEGEESTYLLDLPDGLKKEDVQGNAFTIIIHFSLNDKDYAVTWDPTAIIVVQ